MAKRNYIVAAVQVLTELGGGPLSSKDLVKAAQERGLIGTKQYVYHNFLRMVRESDLFDTSVRGQVSLSKESLVETQEGPNTPEPAAIIENAPAAIIGEILSADLPRTDALDTVEDEEIDPDGTQTNREI